MTTPPGRREAININPLSQNDPNRPAIEDQELTGAGSNSISGAAKENPGALAGATGTDLKSFWSWFDHNLKRQIAASELVSALLNCAPEDRVPFLEILLDQLRPGWPQSLLIDLMREARWWVTNASRAERKAYCLACHEGMPEDDQRSFVAYITGARHG
ncbi:hypothetical protein BDE18_1467 [Paracoccus pantotrophus]|uniref:Uncharacterized protein n=2 Tax=Paracoccaceae TaxID=31989 RepID=A0ABX9SFC2_PARPN|nr:hypothetical protein [Paracoccus pantotrophus]RKS52164.1 hypothetical protein BDE18_1467 [Paracoccus pantotrophus]SFO84167.1 hypothetical protein SAMN04244567_03235 [Paracoccus pantotrophus]